jgi:hypothetical protein
MPAGIREGEYPGWSFEPGRFPGSSRKNNLWLLRDEELTRSSRHKESRLTHYSDRSVQSCSQKVVLMRSIKLFGLVMASILMLAPAAVFARGAGGGGHGIQSGRWIMEAPKSWSQFRGLPGLSALWGNKASTSPTGSEVRDRGIGQPERTNSRLYPKCGATGPEREIHQGSAGRKWEGSSKHLFRVL